jgi:hypothetical protein
MIVFIRLIFSLGLCGVLAFGNDCIYSSYFWVFGNDLGLLGMIVFILFLFLGLWE